MGYEPTFLPSSAAQRRAVSLLADEEQQLTNLLVFAGPSAEEILAEVERRSAVFAASWLTHVHAPARTPRAAAAASVARDVMDGYLST